MAPLENLCLFQVSLRFVDNSQCVSELFSCCNNPFQYKQSASFSGHGEEEIYLNTYDWAFVASCASTYADIVNKMTHNVQMAEQLTFINNKSVSYTHHRQLNLNYPDENYGRENLQLHQIGLQKLHEDGSPILDKFGNEIPNYTQEVSS